MKNSAQFFIQYYLKKHAGFLWGSSTGASDVFWKNFFRLRSALKVEILDESAEKMLLQSTVDGHPFKCYLRSAPSSDIFVFRQVFEHREYMPLVELVKKNNNIVQPLLIIDAGANVGYTAIFLSLFFSKATIVAIEPDTLNAGQIKKNLAVNNINKAEVIIAGVWSHDCWLELKKDKSKGEEWGFYVEESPVPTSLKAIDILNLPQLIDGRLIDILKIDIEGSEARLFEDIDKVSRLLSITKYLAIEIHDDMANRQHIQQVLKNNHFAWFEAGELTIATNQNFVQP